MTEPRTVKCFGWKPDLPDARDWYFQVDAPLAVIPSHKNLSQGFPKIYDQGDLGSCTGNAISAAFAYERKKLGELPDFVPSRLFIYYNERVIEGSVNEDAGASIRDGIKTVVSQGACDEALWPYDVSKFTNRPSNSAYTEARKHTANSYARLTQDLLLLKSCLALGLPFVFGFTVYQSFMSKIVSRTGLMPVPNLNLERSVGGHAVVCCGYNSHNLFMCRNSWGTDWGDPDYPGHFWMPPEVMLNTNMVDDLWTIKSITS